MVLFYLLFPLLILKLCDRYRFLNTIGAIVIAYVVGFIIGNTGILPKITGARETLDTLTTLTVPLAIPLLLFSADIRKWTKMAGGAMLSTLFALIAVTITVFAGFFIFRNQGITGMSDVAGMMTGLYTGSTPNLASIQIALNADEATYLVIVTYDLVVGAVHLLFVMTIAQRLFGKFLPKYKFMEASLSDVDNQAETEIFWGLFKAKRRVPLLKALFIAILIFAAGATTTLFIPESSQMAVVILVITTLGIAASLIPWLNKAEKTFELGMYFIMIFCLVIASLADLWSIDFVAFMIALYVALVVFGSMLIQALLSKIFKVDTDTFLITSTAFICNPAIVPVVAGSLKNREVVFSGLTVGIIGLAIGNYLGIAVAWIASML